MDLRNFSKLILKNLKSIKDKKQFNFIKSSIELLILINDSLEETIETLRSLNENFDDLTIYKIKSEIDKAKYLINVDSEEDGAICIGSAGGGERYIKYPVKRQAIDENYKLLELLDALKDFKKIPDINKKSAIKILTGKILELENNKIKELIDILNPNRNPKNWV